MVMLGNIMGPDLIIVLLIAALVIFGGAAIPKWAKNLGSAKREFEKGLKQGVDPDSDGSGEAGEDVLNS